MFIKTDCIQQLKQVEMFNLLKSGMNVNTYIKIDEC